MTERELTSWLTGGYGTEYEPASSGVYQIRCLPTGKVYIGSAADIRALGTASGYVAARQPHKYPPAKSLG